MENVSGAVKGYLLPIVNYADDYIKPIYFQTYPNITSDSKSANYDTIEIIGRGEPVQIYRSSGSRVISMELTYVAISEGFNFQWVAQQVNRLRALVYPVYSRVNSNIHQQFIPPPLVLLNFGERYVNLPCVIKSVNIAYSSEEVVELSTMLPMITKISLSMETSYPYGSVPGHDDVSYGVSPLFPNYGEAAIPGLIDQLVDVDPALFSKTGDSQVSTPTAGQLVTEVGHIITEVDQLTFAGKLGIENKQSVTA